MSVNHTTLTGNLTRNPELRRAQSGTAVLNFGIAVNDRRKSAQAGEWEDYPNFFDCTMFGSRAEALMNILEKGMKVTVDGKLRWSEWEADGQRRTKVDVIVNEIEFMSMKGGKKDPDGGAGRAPAEDDAPPISTYQGIPEFEEVS